MNANSQPIYQVREVAPADAEALHRHCWSDRTHDGVRELLQRAEWLHARKRGLGIVAELTHAPYEPIAFAQLTLWPRAAEISDLIVTETLRNYGIGTVLINHLVERARSWHVEQVEIGVALSNPRALALYRRLGFHDDRTIKLDIGSGTEAVAYLKMPLETAEKRAPNH